MDAESWISGPAPDESMDASLARSAANAAVYEVNDDFGTSGGPPISRSNSMPAVSHSWSVISSDSSALADNSAGTSVIFSDARVSDESGSEIRVGTLTPARTRERGGDQGLGTHRSDPEGHD